MPSTEYALEFDALEKGGRSDKTAIELTIVFDCPFTDDLDIAHVHVEDISAVRWELYDRTQNRSLGGGNFKPNVSDAWNWAETFRDMLRAEPGLMGELQRYCHDHAGDEADERGHQMRKSQGLDAA